MKLSRSKDNKWLTRATGTGILLVVVAALTLEATSLIQFIYAEKGLEEEASKRAETQLAATQNEIMDVIDQAESAVRNNLWVAQLCMDFPDSLSTVSHRIVRDNPVVVGSTAALVPGYSKRLPLFSPYWFRQGDSLAFTSLATPEYDYPSQEWFTKPLELGHSYWSEPYYDTGGGEVLMTTFSFPVPDREGKMGAVLTADISLDWLTDVLENIQVYPNAHSLMISRTGRFMVSKTRELVMQKTVIEVVDQVRDTERFQKLNRAMLSGESGNITLMYRGKKSHVFYAPVRRTGWSMCIVIPEDDIYGSVRRTTLLVTLLQLLGLAMLILILRSFFKSQAKYNDLQEKRDMMRGELMIASAIQMSMVPKTIHPFPDRHDLDIAADIIPAKVVGGDLYDFFIRDGKLFFCIGDVSGKGVPASLVMAVTRTSFRNVSAREDSPGRIVKDMNDSMAAMNSNDMFVTFFCGVLDLKDGSLRYCNAGHNPPITLTDSKRELPVVPNLPLGVISGMDFTEQETFFNYDDAIFLYTDGLTEAENDREEQFGMRRLQSALSGRKPAEDHLHVIQDAITGFVGSAPQSDDLTMLFIHYLPDTLHLSLRNDIGEIRLLPAFLDRVAGATGLDADILPMLNLALEEAVTNVILYAYPEGSCGRVDIDAGTDGDKFVLTISDSGKAFDPTASGEPDVNASLESRPIGGLGIHLVRRIMDGVSYSREGGKNVLKMMKQIKPR